MAFKHRYADGWHKNAAGLYVQAEPIDASLVAAGTTGDVVAVKSDDTLELVTLSGANVGTSGVGLYKEKSGGEFRFKKIKAGTDITVTATANDEVEIASTASGGGGSSTLPYPDEPPASPNTEDDEFDSSTLDAKWTETLSGVTKTIDTDVPSHYVAKVAGGSSDSFELSQSFAPAGDFSATMAVSCMLLSTSQSLSLFAVDNPTTLANGFGCRINSDNVFMIRRTGGSTTNGTSVSRGRATRNYLHIQRVGTTITVWWSGDGRGWSRIDSQTMTFTCSYLAPHFGNSASTAPHRIAIDWVRRDWITL